MKKEIWLVFVIIAALLIVSCSSPDSNPSPENKAPPLPPAHSITLDKTTSTDWTLDEGWSITATNPLTFKGIGHTWATLTQNLNGHSLMRFTLQRQKGNININVKNNPTEQGLFRYILSIADGTELILQKQLGDGENIQELTQISLPTGTDWSGTSSHAVEIKTVNQQIIVRIDGRRVLFFTDPQPLTRGTLAFETIEDSEFVMSDVQVTAENNDLQEEAIEQNSSLTEVSPTNEATTSPTQESKTTPTEKMKLEENGAFNLPPDTDSSGWTQTSGPLGGVVIRMIPHAGTIWASLYSGGIYELQTDNSWKQIAVGHGIPEVRAFDIVTDPSNVNIAYVPEMIACVAKTTNKGVSWQGLCDQVIKDIEPSDNFNSHTLALDPENPKILYLPGHTLDQTSMLLVSKDAGERWEKRFVFDKHYDFNHLFFFDSKMYLATRDDGVFVSSDQGKSWTPFNQGLQDLKTARFVNFKNSLYLLGAQLQFNARMGGELYTLAPNGAFWEKISGLEQVTGIGTDDSQLFVATWNPDPKLWVSGDGKTFAEQASQGLPPGWIGEIVTAGDKIFVGPNGNGIYISKDKGYTFEEFNKGIISIATREVYVNPKNENEIYVGTWDRLGFYWSKNGGKGYQHLATDFNVFTLQPDPHDFSRVYLGSEQFVVGTVSKEESSFSVKAKPGSKDTIIKSIAIDPTDSNHILVGIGMDLAEAPPGEGLWESYDGGESWTRAPGIGNFAVYSIIFNPHDPQIVYASALGGGVFKSIDRGSHFTALGTDKLKYTYRLVMSPTDPNIIVASSNVFFAQLSSEEQTSGKYGGIFQSKDGGATWKELTAGIRNYEGTGPDDFLPWLYNFGHLPNFENILLDPKNPDHLVVGHHGENVVETSDGGKTWKKPGANEMVPSGIHNYAYCLGASQNFKKFYACTCGRGLFRGITNEKGQISGAITGNSIYEPELDSPPQPRNAAEAREFILSGEYNHQH